MTPLSYHSSNLSLIALETMRLLVHVTSLNTNVLVKEAIQEAAQRLYSDVKRL